MNRITIYPGHTTGVVPAPPSADETRRAMIIAAIMRRGVRGNITAAKPLLASLQTLGARARVEGNILQFYTPPSHNFAQLECDHTSLPLLLPLCMSLGGRFVLQCSTELVRETRDAITALMRQTGFDLSVNAQSFEIEGTMQQNIIEINDAILAGGMMLSLPLIHGTSLRCTSKECKEQINFSTSILRRFGFLMEASETVNIKDSGSLPKDFVYAVCGDYGMALYLLMCGIVSGSVGVTGLIQDSAQPQKRMIGTLGKLNLPVQEMDGAVFAKQTRLFGIDIDARHFPGMLPVIVVLLSLSRGKSSINDVSSLQNKDKDELMQTAKALREMGADITEIGDTMLITGQKTLTGGSADAQGNAYMAMALAVAALGSELPTDICNAPDIDEFITALRGLGVLV